MTKIKISEQEFRELYKNKKIREMAVMFGVKEGAIYVQATKYGLSKIDREKRNPDIIPGGLPQADY